MYGQQKRDRPEGRGIHGDPTSIIPCYAMGELTELLGLGSCTANRVMMPTSQGL